VHPYHSFIEIYSALGSEKPARDFLELEMHGPYRTLQPGESMCFEETWELVDYFGPDTHEGRTAFLNDLLNLPPYHKRGDG
jgi:hypothetical protein